ncbi:hypothetical protein [Caviibacter abscessus]|uniref:hypothetical protein n=1 Tax=Caviibacter abscessus TaxID=1766719 RepID=UPI0008398300|nr:hypothetical protein [Caviibacter abscessus]
MIVRKETYPNDDLVVKRHLYDELVLLKDNEKIDHGAILVQGNDGKYETYKHATHKSKIHTLNIRVYTGDTTEQGTNRKGTALVQGLVDKKHVKGLEELETNNLSVINELEKHNIFLVEVK